MWSEFGNETGYNIGFDSKRLIARIEENNTIEYHGLVLYEMEEQKKIKKMGGTMRLWAYPCDLKDKSLARRVYGTKHIEERHRHRYEVNDAFVPQLEEAGLVFSGMSPDGVLVEMVELKDHPYFIATQAHPEFKSRPNRPHPLFDHLIQAALEFKA